MTINLKDRETDPLFGKYFHSNFFPSKAKLESWLGKSIGRYLKSRDPKIAEELGVAYTILVVAPLLRPVVRSAFRDIETLGYEGIGIDDLEDQILSGKLAIDPETFRSVSGHFVAPKKRSNPFRQLPVITGSPVRVGIVRGFARELRFDNETRVVFERNFADDVTNSWNAPGPGAAAYAVESKFLVRWLRQQQNLKDARSFDSLSTEMPESVKIFLQKFDLSDESAASVASKTGDLYELACAVDCFRVCAGLPASDSVSYPSTNVTDAIDKVRPGLLEDITKFTTNAINVLLEKPKDFGISDLYNLTTILWRVKKFTNDDPVKRFDANSVSKDAILRYLMSTYLSDVRVELKEGGDEPFSAFSLGPNSNDSCLTACWYAVRVGKYFGLLSDPTLATAIRGCQNFILRCNNKELGGFSTSVGHPPELVHTLSGIRLIRELNSLRLLELPKLKELTTTKTEMRRSVGLLLDRCEKRAGGFSLMPEFKASAFGTLLALKIVDAVSFGEGGFTPPTIARIDNFVAALERENGSFYGYAS